MSLEVKPRLVITRIYYKSDKVRRAHDFIMLLLRNSSDKTL